MSKKTHNRKERQSFADATISCKAHRGPRCNFGSELAQPVYVVNAWYDRTQIQDTFFTETRNMAKEPFHAILIRFHARQPSHNDTHTLRCSGITQDVPFITANKLLYVQTQDVSRFAFI